MIDVTDYRMILRIKQFPHVFHSFYLGSTVTSLSRLLYDQSTLGFQLWKIKCTSPPEIQNITKI